MTETTQPPTATEDRARALALAALDATISEDPEALWKALHQLTPEEASDLLEVLTDLTTAVSRLVAVDNRNRLLEMFGSLGPRPGAPQEK